MFADEASGLEDSRSEPQATHPPTQPVDQPIQCTLPKRTTPELTSTRDDIPHTTQTPHHQTTTNNTTQHQITPPNPTTTPHPTRTHSHHTIVLCTNAKPQPHNPNKPNKLAQTKNKKKRCRAPPNHTYAAPPRCFAFLMIFGMCRMFDV